ncbi:AHH domain-containing protein [Corallococcus sp. bb12-1]|uniref:AHH domain-containing protein n=1 Tax=Corallococcus sp. bb12-1 TaxID=2996784 RepID=UPI00226F3A07|nr:AHH domain-containing protein [Corallococcus sp. bb12-1]MCY1041531.1 AHH domain-containing protein [Corallococcus sp. bb12-1]
MGEAKKQSNKHTTLLGQTIPHHTAGSLTGGKCIAKHESPYKENCSCSHRWQAFEKALEQNAMYNLSDEQLGSAGEGSWSLLFRGGAKAVAKLAKQGAKVALSAENKGMYRHQLGKPRQGDWNIDRAKYNFKWDCNKPYYHEAHHVLPDATLRTALIDIFEKPEMARHVVTEVLNAPYSVHDKDNMMILPMDEQVGEMLQLPIHRETKQCSHGLYDMYVLKKLALRLRRTLKEIMKKHDEGGGEPRFKDLAKAIEAVSSEVYVEVASVRRVHGVVSIEEFGKKMVTPTPSSA